MTSAAVSHSGAADPAPVELVNATIDGVAVQVPKGTLVIRAAEQIGKEIPRFCDHPLLEPVGACRQCLVEVAMPGRDGQVRPMPKPQPSCVIEVTEGMEVKTQDSSPVAKTAQEGVMEFLLVNHPLDCPVCDKGGECPLQNQAMSNGQSESRFRDVKRTFPKPIKISTQVLLDRERCVLCQRCTRFSEQIAGDPFIDLQMRGAQQQVGTFSPEVLGLHTEGAAMESESGQPFASYFSGNTVQICPVGALTSAAYRFRSRPFDLVSEPGVCEHCASGCATRVDYRRGTVLRRLAGNDPEVNEEWNCDKGRFAFTWPNQDDRLTHPLVRDADSGELRQASWPEAFEVAAAGLGAARDGLFEADDDSLLQRGVGVLLGGHLTTEDAYGYSKFARVVLGTNDIDFRNRVHSDEEASFLAARVAGRQVDESVTYADLERAKTVLLLAFEPEEESPIVFLRLRKANRKNKTQVISVAPYASRGAQKLNATVVQAAPGTEAGIVQDILAGSPELAEVTEAVRSQDCIILVGERAASTPGLLSAVTQLAEETGAQLAWIPRRAGDRGALDAGALANLLPGGRAVASNEARVDVASAWGVESLPTTPGRSGAALVTAAAEGAVSGLLLAGVDYRDAHEPGELLEAVANTPFVVVTEVRRTALAELADVVFPVAAPVERDGSFVNWEGRRRPFGVALATRTSTDVSVLNSLADYLDNESFNLPHSSAAAAEFAELGPWTGERATAEKVAYVAPLAPASGDAVVASWHMMLDAGLMQDGEPHLAGTAHKAVARVSPQTAAESGLSVGGSVSVSGEHGMVTLPVVITDMPDGVVWVPATCDGQVLGELGIRPGTVARLAAAPLSDAQGANA